MFVSVFILMFSLSALVYWVRSAMLTIMDGDGAMSEAIQLAQANRLEFPQVRQALQAAMPAESGRLADALHLDFQKLTYMLRYAATTTVGSYSRDERLLVMDFHLMRVLHSIGDLCSPRLAQFALAEMTAVLEHFAQVMSSRMSTFALDSASI